MLDRVLTEFKATLKDRADCAEVHYTLGVAYAALGHRDEAEQALRQAAALKSDYWWAHYALGVVLADGGKHADAAEQLSWALRGLPGVPCIYRALGRAHWDRGDPDGTVQTLRAALEACRGSAETCLIHQQLGSAYYALGLYGDATTQFGAAVRSRPKDPHLRVNLGASYLAGGDCEQAARELNKALEADPNLLSALRNLGTLYLKTRQFDDAARLLERAVAIDRKHASTLRKLALARYEQGDEKRAEECMAEALRLEQTASEAAGGRGEPSAGER